MASHTAIRALAGVALEMAAIAQTMNENATTFLVFMFLRPSTGRNGHTLVPLHIHWPTFTLPMHAGLADFKDQVPVARLAVGGQVIVPRAVSKFGKNR